MYFHLYVLYSNTNLNISVTDLYKNFQKYFYNLYLAKSVMVV